MAGVDIQAKIRKGLKRAVNKTGSASSDLIYLIEIVGGGGTPSAPIAPTENPVLLVDAIFKSIDQTNSSGQFDDLIESGDRMLVTNGDVLMKPNSFVQVGADRFFVVDVDVKNPAGVPLAYICLVRSQ